MQDDPTSAVADELVDEASVGVSANPLGGPEIKKLLVRPGATIASLKPAGLGTLICTVNGKPLSRLTVAERLRHVEISETGDVRAAHDFMADSARRAGNWEMTVVRAGDVVVWHEVPQDSDVLRGILTVAIILAAIFIPGFGQYAALALLAVNQLLPPTSPTRNQLDGADDVYSTSLSGNEARLDQPIWRICGRDKVTPPFASQPYYEFRDVDGDNLNNDQYYFAVFALGIGDVDIEQAFIGKTPINHYQDILVQGYLPPGTQPTLALCNVVTSSEVANLELETGRFVGGYAASQPERKATSIGIDITCPFGLGSDGALIVSWRVFVRPIDKFGRATAPWATLANETRTANTNTPQRWSNKYVLSTPARVEIRLARTDIKDTSAAARHSLQWAGLRAYLEEPAPLNANCAHYEIVLRANQQLTSQSQRDFSVIAKAKVRTWNPVDGWTTPVFTRNPAWWIADLWTNPVWGEGLPDSRIDLLSLFNFSKRCDQRQDRFDYTFTSSMNAWDASQLIARAGRGRCFRRYGINTLARDELAELAVTALTHRNTIPGTMVISEKLPTFDVPDGFMIEYVSNVIWDIMTIECPCPGYTYTDEDHPGYDAGLPKMSDPIYKRLDGIKGATHAEREGLYEAANLAYRPRTVRATTEMQGILVSYMAPIRFMPEIVGYGSAGDVVRWYLAGKVMSLSEPADFTKGELYLTLIRDDGSLTQPALVSPGPTAYDVRLYQVPDFDIVTEDGERERTKYLLGTIDTGDELVKVTAIRDGGKSDDGAQLYDIEGLIDDPRVHSADNALLPHGSLEQDPVDGSDSSGADPGAGGDGGDGLTLVLITLKDHYITDGNGVHGGGLGITFELRSDGTIRYERLGDYPGFPAAEFPNEWTLVPIEHADAVRFEVMATCPPGGNSAVVIQDQPLNTWLNLGVGTGRRWVLAANPDLGANVYDRYTYPLTLSIREVGSGIIQQTRTIYMTIYSEDLGTGG